MKAAILVFAAVLVAPHAGAQTLFKCILPNGRVAYQDSKCEDAARQSTVRPPAPPAIRPLPPGDERITAEPQADVEAIVATLASFQGCAQDVPGFATRFNAAYQEWRTRNAAAMVRYGQDPKAQQRVREQLDQQMREAPTSEPGRAERAESCEKDAPAWFASRPPRAQALLTSDLHP